MRQEIYVQRYDTPSLLFSTSNVIVIITSVLKAALFKHKLLMCLWSFLPAWLVVWLSGNA